MPSVYLFGGFALTFLVGIGVGYAIAIVTGADQDETLKQSLADAIEKVRGIDPDPSNPKHERRRKHGKGI